MTANLSAWVNLFPWRSGDRTPFSHSAQATPAHLVDEAGHLGAPRHCTDEAEVDIVEPDDARTRRVRDNPHGVRLEDGHMASKQGSTG